MSEGSVTESVQERTAAVLADHTMHATGYDRDPQDGYHCGALGCEWTWFPHQETGEYGAIYDDFAQHVAAVLAREHLLRDDRVSP